MDGLSARYLHLLIRHLLYAGYDQSKGNTAILSPTFPQLNLTAQQIFNAAN